MEALASPYNACYPKPCLGVGEAWVPRQDAWPEYPRDRWTISVHEAAHLVVTLQVCGPCSGTQYVAKVDTSGGGRVEAHRDGVRVGHAHVIDHPPRLHNPDAWRPAALDRAAVYMAGLAAETLLHRCTEEVTGWVDMQDYPDVQNASRFLAFGWPDHHGGPLWLAWRHALHLLTRDGAWDWVLRVAWEIDRVGHCHDVTAQSLREIHAC